MPRAIFLDRDGTLNKLVYYADWGEYESPRTVEDFALLPGVLDALRIFQHQGWMLFLVSNQPSYAKGKTSLENLTCVHSELEMQLKTHCIDFQAFYYSYTHPFGIVPEYTCESINRKPNPGFLLKAAQDYKVDLRASWMVGDCDTDIFCGQRAGCHTALIEYPLSSLKRGKGKPDIFFADLTEFANHISP